MTLLEQKIIHGINSYEYAFGKKPTTIRMNHSWWIELIKDYPNYYHSFATINIGCYGSIEHKIFGIIVELTHKIKGIEIQ